MVQKKLFHVHHSSQPSYERMKKDFDVIFDSSVSICEPQTTQANNNNNSSSNEVKLENKLTSVKKEKQWSFGNDYQLKFKDEIKSPSKMTSPEKRAY